MLTRVLCRGMWWPGVLVVPVRMPLEGGKREGDEFFVV